MFGFRPVVLGLEPVAQPRFGFMGTSGLVSPTEISASMAVHFLVALGVSVSVDGGSMSIASISAMASIRASGLAVILMTE